MSTQLVKSVGNDYSALGKVISNFTMSSMPILGTLYNSAMSVQFEERLTEMENQIKIQAIELSKLTKFIQTDDGASFFTQCVQNSLSCHKKDRIKSFIAILKGCYQVSDDFDIQYHTILVKTISEMTDAEFLLLSYINSYCNNMSYTQKHNIDTNEFYIVDSDNEYYDASFNKFLTTQENGDYLIENEQFFLLRLSNLGIIKSNRRIMESYNITPLGKQLLTYIESTY